MKGTVLIMKNFIKNKRKSVLCIALSAILLVTIGFSTVLAQDFNRTNSELEGVTCTEGLEGRNFHFCTTPGLGPGAHDLRTLSTLPGYTCPWWCTFGIKFEECVRMKCSYFHWKCLKCGGTWQ